MRLFGVSRISANSPAAKEEMQSAIGGDMNAPPLSIAGGELLANQDEPDNKKRILLLGGGLAVVAASALFLLDENPMSMLQSFLGASSEDPGTAMNVAPNTPSHALQLPPGLTPGDNESGVLDSEDAETDVADTEAIDDSALPLVAVEGEATRDRPWEALNRISEWRTSGEYDAVVLKQYFAHKKVWVRLAALEVAIKQKGLTPLEVRSVAKTLRTDFRKDQMRRWMKRVRERDRETYDSMVEVLKI